MSMTHRDPATWQLRTPELHECRRRPRAFTNGSVDIGATLQEGSDANG